MTRVFAVTGIIAFLLTALSVNTGAESGQPKETSTMSEFLEFGALQRPTSPNHWLVAPTDAAAPRFQLPAERLAQAWVEVVKQAPRSRIVGVSTDGLQVEAEQRSALFGFIDKVSFRAVAVNDESSTFFAYSRSQAGYWDFGVNGRRLSDWVEALQQAADGF